MVQVLRQRLISTSILQLLKVSKWQGIMYRYNGKEVLRRVKGQPIFGESTKRGPGNKAMYMYNLHMITQLPLSPQEGACSHLLTLIS